jgi:hypothetical protein
MQGLRKCFNILNLIYTTSFYFCKSLFQVIKFMIHNQKAATSTHEKTMRRLRMMSNIGSYGTLLKWRRNMTLYYRNLFFYLTFFVLFWFESKFDRIE